MQNINFNDGYKEFSINNDESRIIRFNPSDYGMLERFETARNNIKEELSRLGDGVDIDNNGDAVDGLAKSAEMVRVASDIIRHNINHIFGADVCKSAFGMQSPLSSVGGKTLVERFLDAVFPMIEKEIETEHKASKKRMAKYLGE